MSRRTGLAALLALLMLIGCAPMAAPPAQPPPQPRRIMAACISAAASAGMQKLRRAPARRRGRGLRLGIGALFAALTLVGCAPGAAGPQPAPSASHPDHDRGIINDGGDGGGSM